ncbi:MAG: hypothetical protein AB8B87_02330 [Granulosicoccus sp.]
MIDISAMFPVLVSNELEALQSFYQQHFGFQTEFLDADFYLHLRHPGSNVQLGFMVERHASQPDFLQTRAATEGFVISFEVTNARQMYDQALVMGLEVVFDYKVEVFGLTHFMVRDPAGFVVDIVEHHDQKD